MLGIFRKMQLNEKLTMICRKRGLLEIAERNQIKEGAISGLTYLAIASKKASSTVTTNNADNKNLLPFLGSLQETVTLGDDKCVRDFWTSTQNFLEKCQNSENSCKSNWFKGKIEFVGNSWKSILPRAPLDSSPQASTFPSPHLRRSKSSFNPITVTTGMVQHF